MNSWIKSIGGVSLAGMFVLLATYGKQLAEAGMALWMFVLDAGRTAPLGVASFFVAIALAVSSRYFLRKWLPDLKCPLSRDFLVDATAVVIGLVTVWVQMLDVAPVERIKALWIGAMAGFIAPHVYNGLAAIGGLLTRPVRHLLEKTDDHA